VKLKSKTVKALGSLRTPTVFAPRPNTRFLAMLSWQLLPPGSDHSPSHPSAHSKSAKPLPASVAAWNLLTHIASAMSAPISRQPIDKHWPSFRSRLLARSSQLDTSIQSTWTNSAFSKHNWRLPSRFPLSDWKVWFRRGSLLGLVEVYLYYSSVENI